MEFKNTTPSDDATIWERKAGKVTVSALNYALGQIRIQVQYAYEYGDDVMCPEL